MCSRAKRAETRNLAANFPDIEHRASPAQNHFTSAERSARMRGFRTFRYLVDIEKRSPQASKRDMSITEAVARR